jgi:large subunit ribosomal protein L17
MKHSKLSRNKDHRQHMLSNLASSAIIYERITTTATKARETQRYIERLLSRTKSLDKMNAIRYAQASLSVPEAAAKLIEILIDRYKNIPSGYTRVIKLGHRRGDNADIAILDFTIKTAKPSAKAESGKKAKKDETPADESVDSNVPVEEDEEVTHTEDNLKEPVDAESVEATKIVDKETRSNIRRTNK